MSERKNILRAAGVLGFATIISRIMGMVRDMVQSRLFGAGYATDAFVAAFMIPNMLRRFFAEGALTSAFVPTFSDAYTKRGEEAGRELANVCFTILIIVMAGVTILGIVFSPAIVSLMFPGFRDMPNKLELTVMLNRLMFPYIFFISLVALCMGILNTVRHFFTPAISTVFLNISMIACAVGLHRYFEVPVTALAVGVVVGGLLQLMLQLPVLYRYGFRLRFRPDFRNPDVKRIALLMGPAVFGVGVYYLNITVGNILASLLPQGSVSYLYYAQRLFEFPQGIFTVSVAQAVLPSMSRQAAAGEMEAMKDSLNFGLRLALFITIPATAGLMVASTPVFSLLFMGGAFDYTKVVQCSIALFYYATGLAVVALVRVVVPAFYALKDTKTPVVTAFVAFLLNFAFSLILMKPLLHAGLALATPLSSLCNLALLLWLLRRKIGPFGSGLTPSALKGIAASLPMAVMVWWLLRFADWSATGQKLWKSTVLLGSVGTGAAIYFGCAMLLGSPEVRAVVEMGRRKLRRG